MALMITIIILSILLQVIALTHKVVEIEVGLSGIILTVAFSALYLYTSIMQTSDIRDWLFVIILLIMVYYCYILYKEHHLFRLCNDTNNVTNNRTTQLVLIYVLSIFFYAYQYLCEILASPNLHDLLLELNNRIF